MGILEGKVAIVTGGGRGIGREHCLELARQGAAVVVNDPGVGVHGEASDERPADAVVAEIEALGGRAVANFGSVANWDDCAALVEQAVDTFGCLDILVNNAGIVRDRMITSMNESDFDAVIAVHLKGTFSMTKHACDHWRARAKRGEAVTGRIINTTSGAGLLGNIGQAAYSAAKGGITSLTLVTALEMDRYHVTANAVSPVALTRLSATVPGLADAEGSDAWSPMHPGNTAPVVAYLASDAAAWITGQVLRVDGNRVQRVQGFQVQPDGFTASSGERLAAGELDVGLRRLFGAFPAGVNTASMVTGTKT